jgi:hypothetical protein
MEIEERNNLSFKKISFDASDDGDVVNFVKLTPNELKGEK